ncbi:MAG: Lrp/AsnC family transcriptional regulator, partial [Actinobacteria bacterium]|nr:Lrp/AsnC family transcriptional regulator [Actinomycetota bacterium]
MSAYILVQAHVGMGAKVGEEISRIPGVVSSA